MLRSRGEEFMANRGYVLTPGEGRRLDMGPFSMVVKASAEDSDGGLTLLEAVEPPGFGPPLHIHDDSAEAFYVLDGEYIVHIDGTEHRCPTGTFVYVHLTELAARHAMRVTGPVPEGYQ
jgi:mannose-6-phosphate isomerase-like protein (cupin superfamily)